MTSTIQKTEDNTITIKVTITWAEVKKVWDQTVSEMIANAQLPGFPKPFGPKLFLPRPKLWLLLKKVWDQTVSEMIANAQLPGFRKGKAPKKLVEEKLNKQTIREEVLRKLLPQGYIEAVQKNNLRPIIDPK